MGAEHWLWLAAGLGYGAVNSGEVLLACPGGARAVQEALGSEKLDAILTQKQAERLAGSRPEDFALRVMHMEAAGIAVLGFDDERYPDTLRRIMNPPPALFVKGDTAILNGQLAIGMVGARRPSAYGVEAARAIGRGIALGGAVIVSGLAAGLDTEAHKAALAVNGPTVACIAFGHEQCYPAANRRLMEVIGRNGAVVSEYPPETEPEKPYFLHRNRIIAGLSHGLVVVEARRYSGTMSTVNFAIDYGRDVFAVPGSIFSELSSGTNAMIREGAYLAGSAADVLSVYGVEGADEDPAATLERSVFEGRPEAADSTPPWQRDYAEEAEEAQAARQRETLLREAAQARERAAQQEANRVDVPEPKPVEDSAPSAAQVVQAFRAIQQVAPPTSGSEVAARSQMLDDMVNAVTDSVEIGSRGSAEKPQPAKSNKTEKNVQPFEWSRLEKLDKRQVEDLSSLDDVPAKPGRKPTVASRVRGGKDEQKKPVRTVPIYSNYPVRGGPVGAVEAVSRVEPVIMPAPVQPVTPVHPANRAAQKTEPPAPKAPPKQSPPLFRRQDVSSLAGRLSTLQPGPAKPQAQPQRAPQPERADGFKRTSPVAPAGNEAALNLKKSDPLAALSEEAQRAYKQLGPTPVSLAAICEKSGLSSAEAMAALTELELEGLSRQLAGRQFVIAM